MLNQKNNRVRVKVKLLTPLIGLRINPRWDGGHGGYAFPTSFWQRNDVTTCEGLDRVGDFMPP